jgi:hypothetical protein
VRLGCRPQRISVTTAYLRSVLIWANDWSRFNEASSASISASRVFSNRRAYVRADIPFLEALRLFRHRCQGAEAGRLHLSCVCVGDKKWKDVAEIVPIVRVPCRLGGSRNYFICPGFQNGRECGRRVAKL